MGGIRIEIIARAVEVGGKKENGIESELSMIGLGLDQHHFLCQPIRSIRFLRIPVP
jgi:hypothetical protein